MSSQRVRRAQHRAGFTAHAPTQKRDFAIEYGHNGAQVAVIFCGGAIQNLMLSIEQTDAMIEGLNIAKEKLREHLASQSAGEAAHG